VKFSKRKLFTLSFFISLLVLGYVSPVLADYLGPDRTVTVTTTDCDVTLYSCEWVEVKGIWKYKQSDFWSCQNESKPWQKYPSSEQTCDASNSGYEYWEKSESESTNTVTYPPATVSGALQGCTLYNGWCNTNPTLDLSASEPVAGYQITSIEGTRNGVAFTCPAGTNCDRSFAQGDNTFTFWAHSSFGDTSTSSTIAAKVDTVAPTVSSVISGSAGMNGWYISNVTASASGMDATSGLSSAQVSINGGAWQANASLADGTYTVNSRTVDNAGNTAVISSTIRVDTIAPSVTPVIPLADGSNGWIKTGPVVISTTGTDLGSGLASAQVSVDHGAWRSNAVLSDGIHTVQFRSVDVAGNSTILIKTVKVDATVPSVIASTKGSSGDEGWFVSQVITTIVSTDSESGVDHVEYRHNGGNWQTGASITSLDGVNTLDVRVYDLAGNVAASSFTVNVDTIAPGLTPVIPPADGSNGWIKTRPAMVSATGTDLGSGLASAQVSVDYGAWRSNAALTDGIHTVQFRSVDLAGNSTSLTRTVKVDATVPSVIASTEGLSGSEGWYVGQATTTITSTDSVSGVDHVEYSHNGGSWQAGTSVTSLDGVNTLDVRVYDLAGNVAAGSYTVNVDTIAPSVSAILPDPDGFDGWVVTGPAVVSANGADEGSGLASAQVSLKNGPWVSSLSLPDGVHPVRFKAMDKAGNSSITIETIKVDATAPSLSFTRDGTPGNFDWYISPVVTSILAGDDMSGIANVQYNQNNTGWEDGVSFKSSEGVNSIDVKVSDAAGNVSTDTLQIKVDTIAPSTSFLVVGTPGRLGWYISNTTTNFTPDDRTSGIDHVEYSQNGEDWRMGSTVESRDGINSISMRVYDRAGNVSADTLDVKVDTGRPSSAFVSPSNGSANNLVRGVYPISGSSTDTLSGVSEAELSFDGSKTWTALGLVGGKWTYDLNSTALADGVYRVVIRTTDLAGNVDTLETSTAYIHLIINNDPPDIKLTPGWFIWQTGSLSIRPGYFPLKRGMVTISDPQKRWPRVEIPFDDNYPRFITWDRRFANGILAPSGDYEVNVIACNIYDLCSNKRAIISVPWIAVILPTPAPTVPSSVEPAAEDGSTRPSGVLPDPVDSPRITQPDPVAPIPPIPAQAALAPVILVALMWALSSASLSDARPAAINAIAKTISQRQVNIMCTKE
jgi:hypothetical protein